MTDKELVEFIYDKLMVQGCKSADSEEQCLYRGPKGTKCAVGWLISDENYDPNFEKCSIYADTAVGTLNPVGKYLNFIGYGEQLRLLQTIQDVHDCAAPNFRESIFEGFTGLCKARKIQAELKPVSHYENG